MDYSPLVVRAAQDSQLDLFYYKSRNVYGLILALEIHLINPFPDTVKRAAGKQEKNKRKQQPLFYTGHGKNRTVNVVKEMSEFIIHYGDSLSKGDFL